MTRASAQQRADVVRRGYEALRGGDLPGLAACMADEVVVDRPSLAAWGKVQHGRKYFVDVITRLMNCAAFEITDAQVLEGTDEVVGILAYTLTARNSGEKMALRIVELFKVEGGLITSIDVYDKNADDLAAFLARAEQAWVQE